MPYIQLEVVGDGAPYPPLIEVSSFIYDLNFAYELSLLATDPSHGNYVFSEETWYRTHRPIPHEQQLNTLKVQHESPLLLVAAVAALPATIGAIWGLVQIVEKVANFSLNRENLKLQVEKLRKEVATQNEKIKPLPEVHEILAQRDGDFLFQQTIKRLSGNTLQITHFDITVVPKLPAQRRRQRDSPSA
jgi:hypothetical protein